MIAIIFCGDLKYCPYLKRYTERLSYYGIEYNVYFWNRSGLDINLPDNYKFYELKSNLNKSKISKLLDFIRFRIWLLDILKKDNPDRMIILSTLTGVLLGRLLYSKKSKYIFDIRDYSYEHIKLFYSIEKKIIEHSAFTAISSKGFMNFLPAANYVIAHNFNRTEIDKDVKFNKHDGRIRFVWNGVIRYFEFQKRYLDALKNDERFEIVYHGDGPELNLYKEYCSRNGFNNVTFTGSYDNNDKATLLNDADILNNCYGYNSGTCKRVKYAVSNRLYDGMVYHIPQLVEPAGYKTDWVKKSGIGIAIDIGPNFPDELYNYYRQINEQSFDDLCNSILKDVVIEDDKYIYCIDKFING